MLPEVTLVTTRIVLKGGVPVNKGVPIEELATVHLLAFGQPRPLHRVHRIDHLLFLLVG